MNSRVAPSQPPRLDRIRHYANDLAQGLGKVASKFVQDAVTGIYLAKSVNLTEIAHALDEDIAIHATQKRLSRNLGRANIRDAVSEALLTMAARRVHKDTTLNVHVRDLTKRYARKMQYLFSPEPSPVQNPNGYRICEVVACELNSDRHTPIAAHLWSCHAPGFTSDSEEIITTIRRVLAATHGRGIVHPSPSVYDHGTEVEDLAAIEGMRGLLFLGAPDPEQGKRWIYRHRSMSDVEIADICNLPYGVTLYKMHPDDRGEESIFTEFGSVKVGHSSLRDRLGSLVINRYDAPGLRDLPKQPYLVFSTVPLTNTRTALTAVESVIVSGPQTVAANIEHKDSYNLAGFRVLSYHRMQTLLTLLQATAFYETAVTRRARIVNISGSLKPQPGNHPRTFLLPETSNQQTS